MSTDGSSTQAPPPDDGFLPEDNRPTNVRWIVFGLGCGTSWFLYLHRYLFGLMKPKLIEEWNLGEEQLGLLDGAFSLCYSLFQLPAGILVDVLGAHFFLGGMILLWSVALALHAWAPNIDVLWYGRALLGAGQAGAFASVSRISRTWFPSSVRTSTQGWMGVFSGRIGGLSANLLFAAALVGWLQFDWRVATYILAGGGVVHGILFLLLFRNSPRHHPLANQAEVNLIEEVDATLDARNEARPELRRRMTVREMLRRMSPRSILNLMCLTLTSTLSTIADNIYSNWVPLFLSQEYGLKFKEMGIYSALPLLGGACGGAFSGYLNDWLIHHTGNRRWTRSLIGLSGKGIAGVVLLVALLTSFDNPYEFCAWLFLVKFFADMGLASRWGTITDIGGQATATVFSLNNSLASIGAVLAPILYGFVVKDYGWKPVFYIAVGVYALCALSWLLINCTIPLFGETNDAPSAER